MWIPCLRSRALTLGLAAAALSLVFASRAAQTPASASPRPPTPEPPKSVFVNPATPLDGKDPFFPQSTRHRPVITVVTPIPTNAPPPAVELELKGISGTPDHRLAIINNATFEVGEQAEVVTNLGRVRITCKDIKTDSVEVVVNGQARVLNLRQRL